jgi:hypothetical protein
MKVKDLIKDLKKFNPEMVVVIDRDEYGWLPIEDVTEVDGEYGDKLISINTGV